MIAVGAVSLGWGDTSLPRLFDELGAMGGECVEINGRPGLHDGLVLDDRTIPRVRSWAEAAGLVVSGISGYNDFAQTDPDALGAEQERLLGTCRVASDMHVELVRAFAGEPKPGLAMEDAWPTIVEAFRWVARHAEALGVTVAIENHGRLLNDGSLLAALVCEIGESSVALTLDTGNFAWAGHSPEQVSADIEAALPYAANLQVKDGVWRNGSFEFVPAGEGALDLADLLRRLIERGYHGPVNSEYEGAGDFLEGTRRSIAYLRDALGSTRR